MSGGMAAGLFRFTIATAERILRNIAFGFLVVTVPPAGCVQSHLEFVCADTSAPKATLTWPRCLAEVTPPNRGTTDNGP
jgi:hypothetical protein